MDENELYFAKEYKFDNPLITDKASRIDGCFRDCHNSFFQNIIYESICDTKLTNMTDNEIVILTISGKSLILYEKNTKLKVARHNGFLFNQKQKLTIKIHSHLRYINKRYYLKFQIPICNRQFFGSFSQNREYINNFCNDVENPFHFACQKWFIQLN